jgi:hypothetical protein
VDVLLLDAPAEVRSPDGVTSPLSGRHAAFFHVEVLELLPPPLSPRVLGERILGDVVELAVGGRVASVLVRRAALRFALIRPPPVPLVALPAELASLVAHTRAGIPCAGPLGWREHVVRHGDRIRLRAYVEAVKTSGADRLVVRDDLGPVELHEVVT